MNRRIHIVLVDDHAIVREGYRALLNKHPALQVVAEAADGEQGYSLYKQYQPDVVITDLTLPGSSGMQLIARIKQRDSQARILVFSMHHHVEFVRQSLRAGALGYVSKSSLPEVLVDGIHSVFAGRLFLSDDIAQQVAAQHLVAESGILACLTAREFEILRLLVAGNDHRQIADWLHISCKTVANSHYRIKSKLSVDSDIALVHLAIRQGIVSILQ